ncbi:hypothetical protein GCM10011375_10980 [Hymenobacter qilianensis]|uniref:Uncharacterized protein n=1 Tax=Hymenobacter qilianensis TaxID=1385715 RepID=A0ACB5PNX6_9BACT|nr:CHRD domain-containing protein [Hymenobacter qilianensis]GGF57648.1 hypothetical protein GCM10011375_10980 [Hymenobacter qilianensis]
MLQKLTSGFLLLLSLGIVSACDQFDLDDLRKKAPPSPPEISLSATLTDNQVVPRRPNSSLSIGAFTATYDQQTNLLTYVVDFSIFFTYIPEDELHLHRGAPGTNGPIAYTLPSHNGTITLTEADEALLLEGNMYVDAEVGNPLYTRSRGAIIRQPSTPVPVPGPQVALTARVDGSQVVPPTSSDRKGIINAIYNKDTNVLAYWSIYTTNNLSFTSSSEAVHLHRGAPGTNGPIIATLSFPGGYYPQGEASIPEADEGALLSGGTYIDVHRAEFPNGEARGAVVPQ